eukprot:15465208-Alexandrium_andersonii.AAC.1
MVPVTWCKCQRKSIFSSCSLGCWNCTGLSLSTICMGRDVRSSDVMPEVAMPGHPEHHVFRIACGEGSPAIE